MSNQRTRRTYHDKNDTRQKMYGGPIPYRHGEVTLLHPEMNPHDLMADARTHAAHLPPLQRRLLNEMFFHPTESMPLKSVAHRNGMVPQTCLNVIRSAIARMGQPWFPTIARDAHLLNPELRTAVELVLFEGLLPHPLTVRLPTTRPRADMLYHAAICLASLHSGRPLTHIIINDRQGRTDPIVSESFLESLGFHLTSPKNDAH